MSHETCKYKQLIINSLLVVSFCLNSPLLAQTGDDAPVQLNHPLQESGLVFLQRVSPDGSRVVYLAREDGKTELYSAPIGGGTVVKLNDTLATGGDVLLFTISPDSRRVLFLMNRETDTDDVRELFSVPIAGGDVEQLNGALATGGNVLNFSISPSSAWVTYRADQDTDEVFELYRVPITGGPNVKLNSSLVTGGNVVFSVISPDSTRVVYMAGQDIATATEIYSVSIANGSVTKLNDPLTSPLADAREPTISSDGMRVLYISDQNVDQMFELYSAPITGSTPPEKLSGSLVSGGQVFDLSLIHI